MTTKLSPTVPLEYSPKNGFAYPSTSRTGRGTAPSYAVQGSLGVYGTEQVTFTMTGAVGTLAVSTLTGKTFLQTTTSLSLSSTDQAQLLVVPVSVVSDGPCLIGNVNLSMASVGQPAILTTQTLLAGRTYTGLQVVGSASVYNPTGGTLNPSISVIAQVLILGNVTQ